LPLALPTAWCAVSLAESAAPEAAPETLLVPLWAVPMTDSFMVVNLPLTLSVWRWAMLVGLTLSASVSTS
jgi:hypothetical protein